MKRMEQGDRGIGGFAIPFPIQRQYRPRIPVLIQRTVRFAFVDGSGTANEIPHIFLRFE